MLGLCGCILPAPCLRQLVGEVSYETAHPCPKCEGCLRAVGVREVRHTSSATPFFVTRTLGPPLPALMRLRDGVCSPLRIALREEYGMHCERLAVQTDR
jgi:hypothetical protein